MYFFNNIVTKLQYINFEGINRRIYLAQQDMEQEKVQSKKWHDGLVMQEHFSLPCFIILVFLTCHNFMTCQDQAARDMKRLEDKDKEKKNVK